MPWQKPDDLELVAECETEPEVEILRGLLAGCGIDSMKQVSAESSGFFQPKSLLGEINERPRPYKLLVRPEDAESAREIITAPAEPIPEEDDE